MDPSIESGRNAYFSIDLSADSFSQEFLLREHSRSTAQSRHTHTRYDHGHNKNERLQNERLEDEWFKSND